MKPILARFGVRVPTTRLMACDYRRIVRISRQHTLTADLMGMPNHAEQGVFAVNAINGPAGVKNLVPAVFRIGLGKHHEFNVTGITSQIGKRIDEIFNLVGRQRQSQPGIGLDQGGLSTGQDIHTAMGRWFRHGEQTFQLRSSIQDRFDHAIMDQGVDLQPGTLGESPKSVNHIANTPLDPANGFKAAIVSNICGLAGPGGNRAHPGHNILALLSVR